MAEAKVRRHIIFRGSVQGVGFRYRASHLAGQLDLTGWVCNNWDGSVEMEVQGSEAAIGMLVEKLYTAPFIQIDDYESAKIPVCEDERRFCVKDYY